jgi:hypothetical protein
MHRPKNLALYPEQSSRKSSIREFQDLMLFAENLQELIRYAVLRRSNNITSETYVMLFNGLSRTSYLCVVYILYFLVFILCTRICVERAVSTVAYSSANLSVFPFKLCSLCERVCDA